LDDLAACWGERLRGPRPEPGWLDPAPEIIFDAITRAEKINLDRDYLAGATDEVKGTLDKLGLNDDVSLANADPEALGKELNNPGLAGRLVMQARQIVPESAWSLEALNLDDQTRGALIKEGLDSQGTFARAAADQGARERVSEKLGTGGDRLIGDLAESAIANMTEASVKQAPATVAGYVRSVDASATGSEAGIGSQSATSLAVANLATVAPAEARALQAAGIQTVGSLATADISKVEMAFGGNVTRARAVMRGVQSAMFGK
jgi:hypothetical protein